MGHPTMLHTGRSATDGISVDSGDHDVLLGHVGGAPFYIDARQYEAWKHTKLILDVGAGEPEGFSLTAGDDQHFITGSRVCAPGELADPRPGSPR